MSQSKALIALDVGEKRIGVATADGVVHIARPLVAVEVDGTEIERICALIQDSQAAKVIIGYPRNQSGEPTAQTTFVEEFKERLAGATGVQLLFQDESLTSVLAEEQLKSYGRPYTKADIDSQAAVLILQDYLEKSAQ